MRFYFQILFGNYEIYPIVINDFRACDDNFKLCAYPSAHVRLTKRNQLLMKGQQYKFRIQLEMPESPVNMKLGTLIKKSFKFVDCCNYFYHHEMI